MKTIVRSCRAFGANSVHVRIPSPPVVDRCQLGIAIHSKKELLMNGRTVSQAAIELGCDSLKYLSISDLDILPSESYKGCFGEGLTKIK